jgi:hypothetical protein
MTKKSKHLNKKITKEAMEQMDMDMWTVSIKILNDKRLKWRSETVFNENNNM